MGKAKCLTHYFFRLYIIELRRLSIILINPDITLLTHFHWGNLPLQQLLFRSAAGFTHFPPQHFFFFVPHFMKGETSL
nr:MAG TPA: hypothetical protein [Caudoviricetes sp.]